MRRLIKFTALVAVMVFWAAASYAADDFLSMFKAGKPIGHFISTETTTKLIRQMTDQALPEDGKPSAHMDPTFLATTGKLLHT